MITKIFSAIFFILVFASPLTALAWPDKPVKIVISLPVGSGPDVQLRRAAKSLSAIWQQPVLVENRPGGSGRLAIGQLQKEGADAYTIGLFSQGDIVAFPILYEQTQILSAIEPVSPFFTADMVLFASPSITSIADLKNEIIRNPFYGSWAVGSVGHVTSAEFAAAFVNNAQHVPYKEYGPWYIDTANRALAFGFTSFGSGNAMQSAGRIRYLAVAAAKRDPRFPDLPTIKEATGLDLQAQSWLAFFIHSQVPQALKRRIDRDLKQVITSAEIQDFIKSNFFIPLDHLDLADFRKQIDRDRRDYQQQLKTHNITINK